MSMIREVRLEVDGRPALVHVGGAGSSVVLLHGGFGGARLHWSRVWEPLADRFRVIAPDLPGIGDLSQPGLGPIAAYARWVETLVARLEAGATTLVGNSLGAAIASALAAQHPDRCRALVLVNGVPLPSTPRWLMALGTWPPTRRALLRLFERNTCSSRARELAFARSDQLPAELLRAFEGHRPPQLEALFQTIGHGGDGAPPCPPPLLLWGEADRLTGSSARVAEALHRAVPGSRLAFVPAAGHLPQLENPEAFLSSLVPFLSEMASETA
jgi:2-hydroxy-6-oxonona-2,4-dienedioate hydrolase